MSKVKQNNRRVFVSFSASFLLFIIIPILVLNIAAWQAIRITEVTRLNHARTLLRH